MGTLFGYGWEKNIFIYTHTHIFVEVKKEISEKHINLFNWFRSIRQILIFKELVNEDVGGNKEVELENSSINDN